MPYTLSGPVNINEGKLTGRLSTDGETYYFISGSVTDNVYIHPTFEASISLHSDTRNDPTGITTITGEIQQYKITFTLGSDGSAQGSGTLLAEPMTLKFTGLSSTLSEHRLDDWMTTWFLSLSLSDVPSVYYSSLQLVPLPLAFWTLGP